MGRANYCDDIDHRALAMWRGAVASGLRGARGQSFLREAIAVMDAMPVKVLVDSALEADGAYCTLGVVGAARGVNLGAIDPEDHHEVARQFNLSDAAAREIMFENDEGGHYNEQPAVRWGRMRAWLASQLNDPVSTTA